MKSLLKLKTISYAITLSSFLVSGCAALPLAERQANATTEVSEKWSRDQKERIKATVGAVANSGGIVEWSVDSHEDGNGDQSLLGGLENTIPGGIKLVYFGIGILVVLFAVKQVSNSSSAVKATLRAADDAIARQIRKLEGRLQGKVTDQEKAELMSQLRDLENERGKLRT
jgi:hypothetical protein